MRVYFFFFKARFYREICLQAVNADAGSGAGAGVGVGVASGGTLAPGRALYSAGWHDRTESQGLLLVPSLQQQHRPAAGQSGAIQWPVKVFPGRQRVEAARPFAGADQSSGSL